MPRPHMLRYSLFGLCLLMIVPQDFREIFGEDYEDALVFLQIHTPELTQASLELEADLDIICPMVFPELIRYSQFRDFFETQGLELAYIHAGTVAADFSIGRFQMKPSFIEKMEVYLAEHDELSALATSICFNPELSPKEIRTLRLSRLKDLTWQCKYACAFYHILLHKYPEEMKGEKNHQIKFAASAYNHGFQGVSKEVMKWSEKSFFPYGVHYPGKQYAYTAISQDFYQRHYRTIFN